MTKKAKVKMMGTAAHGTTRPSPLPHFDDMNLDIPDFLKIPQSERDEAWRRNPPKPQVFVVDNLSGQTPQFLERAIADAKARDAQRKEKREASHAKREERTQRREAKKTARTGLIHVATIASDLKISAREARGALRALKYTKPEHGWWFTPDQIAQVTKDIRTCLAKPTTQKPSTKSSPTSEKASPPPSSRAGSKTSSKTSNAPRNSSSKKTKAKASATSQTKRGKSSRKS